MQAGKFYPFWFFLLGLMGYWATISPIKVLPEEVGEGDTIFLKLTKGAWHLLAHIF
jgi:hypothetical protein